MIHNGTFLGALPRTFAEQAYFWANFHEAGVFSDPAIDGIGNSELFLIHRWVVTLKWWYSRNPIYLAIDILVVEPYR